MKHEDFINSTLSKKYHMTQDPLFMLFYFFAKQTKDKEKLKNTFGELFSLFHIDTYYGEKFTDFILYK